MKHAHDLSNRERGGAGAVLLLMLLLGAAGGGWWWYGQSQKVAPIDADRVVRVQRRDLLRAVIATGRFQPLAKVSVMSRASGILKERFVEEGDRVTKGQILAELDREQLVAQHDENIAAQSSAKARLAAAKARLEEAKVRLVDPELEFAKLQHQRILDLHRTDDASETEVDDARLRVANVEYRLKQAAANIPVLEAGVVQAEADILQADAAVERSATSLREATIRSPIDGVVLLREKDVGDGISSILTAGGNATPVFTLCDVSSMYVEAKVDEVDVGKIHEGMRAVVSVDAYRDRPFEGKVERIAPGGTVDNNGLVTFEVRIAVDDPEKLLRVDMTATTRLVLEDRPAALSLPHKALSRDAKGNWFVAKVLSEQPPATERIGIQIGVSDGLVTEIVEGLAEGDPVLLPSDRPQQMG